MLGLAATAAGAAGRWSAPAQLAACSAPAAPLVTFPQSNPYTRTGTGAVVWGGDPSRCGPGAVGPSGLGIAAIASDDRVQRPGAVSGPTAAGLIGPSGMSATCGGRLVVTAGLPRSQGVGGAGVLVEGKVGESFGAPLRLGGPATPQAVTRAYRGDIAVASVGGGSAGAEQVLLRLQPYNVDAMRAPIVLQDRVNGIDAISVALDFRADALVVWHSGHTIYAREWLQPGQLGPIQRLGTAGPTPQLQPLISDNGHAMAVWTEATRPARGAGTTRIYISVARHQHRFEPAHVIERYANVAGVTAANGAIRLVRLSTETVVLGWTGMSHGHYAVKVAPVSIDAVPTGHVISAGAGDALLADLAAGPHGQALALWTRAPRSGGRLDASRRRIEASIGRIARHFRPRFGEPEMVAAAMAGARNASAVYDPSSNRAVAVWQGLATPAPVLFAVRTADSVGHPRVAAGAAACPALVGHPFRTAVEIAAAALAGALVLAAGGWWVLRRRSS